MDKAREIAALRKEIRKKSRMRENPDPYEAMAFKGLNLGKGDLMDILDDPNERKQFINNFKANRKGPTSKLMGLFRDGMKLTHLFLGKNISNFDERTIKLLSPRLFSVTEGDKGDEGEEDDPKKFAEKCSPKIDVLSPSLLSLHGKGKGFERELSLPNLIKGFTTADQQQWLDLIFEASGVEETLQKANNALIAEEFQARKKRSYEETMRTSDGQPLYFTKEKAIEILGESEKNRTELHETLIKSYTSKQLKEINENGYAILNSMQLELLYGPNSPHKNLKMIENFGNRSEESIHEQIYDEIHQLATNVSFQRRQKDIVLSPILFSNFLFVPEQTSTPLILSPVLFTNIVGSPITLGPTILENNFTLS
uniref:Uncharacterized protein n=1 Tax=Panagrolaimus davidi TaxID=227884 RepID=A0A914QD31_9BILA